MGRPLLTSPFKGRNKNLSLFGRRSPLERGDLEGSFFAIPLRLCDATRRFL